MTRSLQLLTFVLVAITASAPAFARPTKVALTIDDDSDGLRKAVVSALDETDLEIISAKKTSRAIERLGLDDVASARDAKKLGNELDVETVVKAAFDNRAHKLKFTIFKHGKKGASFTVKVSDAKSAAFRKAVRTTMLAKLSDGDEEADDGDQPAKGKAKASKKAADDEDKPGKDDKVKGKAKTSKKATEDEEAAPSEAKSAKPKKHADEAASDESAEAKAEPKHTRKAKHDDDADGAAHGKQVADDDADAPGGSAARDRDDAPTSTHARFEGREESGANLAAVRVDLGASLTGRSLRFQSTMSTGAPANYQNVPVPGGRVEAELYPVAASDRTSLLAGLGIAADFDQTAGLSLPASMAGPAVKLTQRHYSVGARYRIAFGHRATSPTVTLGVGYAARSFTVDRSTGASIDLPDVDYRMFDPGLAVRLPLGTRVALTAGGQALLLTSAGPIASQAEYGRAHMVGGSVSAGVDVALGRSVALRVVGEATQLDFKFYGTGMLSASRDGDPTTIDVHGAVDRYFGGAATLAVMY